DGNLEFVPLFDDFSASDLDKIGILKAVVSAHQLAVPQDPLNVLNVNDAEDKRSFFGEVQRQSLFIPIQAVIVLRGLSTACTAFAVDLSCVGDLGADAGEGGEAALGAGVLDAAALFVEHLALVQLEVAAGCVFIPGLDAEL